MKHFVILILLLTSNMLNAQTALNIGLAKQKFSGNEGLEDEQVLRYEQKLEQALAENEMISLNLRNNIVIIPKLVFNNDQIVNPGVQTLNVVDAELFMKIIQEDGGVVFAAFSKKIQGSGRNRNFAINNLISNVDLNKDEEFQAFITKGKTKAIAYYNTNCTQILGRINQLKNLKQYESALNALVSIPVGTNCFTTSQPLLAEVFALYQKRECQTLLRNGEALLAQNRYDEGFEILSAIDPTSPCGPEVRKIIKANSKEIDVQRERLRYWNYLNNLYMAQVAVSAFRMDSINKLLLLYSQRNPYYY